MSARPCEEVGVNHNSAPSPPRAIDGPSMQRLVESLRRHGYTETGCASRLGVDPLLGIQFFRVPMGRLGQLPAAAAAHLPPEDRPPLRWCDSHEPLSMLMGLLLAGERVPMGRSSFEPEVLP